jgi:hypothetical protein
MGDWLIDWVYGWLIVGMLLFFGFFGWIFFFRAPAGAWLMSEPRKGESEGKERQVEGERIQSQVAQIGIVTVVVCRLRLKIKKEREKKN